jgi:hypothetical protein
MNLADLCNSDASSDSDPEFSAILRGTTRVLTEDYSIDSLLATREKDLSIRPRPLESPAPSLTTPSSGFVCPIHFRPFVNRDITIFSPADFRFPVSLLDKIQRPTISIPDFPPLLEWQRLALETCPEFLPPKSDFLFASFTFCVQSGSSLLAEKVASYASTFPARSIPFDIWLTILLTALPTNTQLAAIILATARADVFQFQSPEYEQTAFRELFLLYFGLIVNPEGVVAVRSFRRFLNDWNGVDDDTIVWLVEQCCNMALELPLQSLACWFGVFPMAGCGTKFLYGFGTRICQILFRGNADGIPAMGEFAGMMSHLRILCASGIDDDFLKASAALTAIEKVVIAAIRLRIVDRQTIYEIARSLKFSFSSSDISDMTNLKEQFHVTRAQLELLSRIDFRV